MFDDFLQIIGIAVLLFGSVYGFAKLLSKPEPSKPQKKEPVIDKVCIWYEDNNNAEVYDDVKEAFVFTNNNLLRIITNNGSKVYVALNTKGFKRLNVYYKQKSEYFIPEADDLD